jgi:F0F1-type ATP synthase membrane subunit b/b'
MGRRLTLILVCALMLAFAPPAAAASMPDRIEELQQELDSLTEEVEDLQAPVAEFELFEE